MSHLTDEKQFLWHVIAYDKKCDIIYEDYCFSNEEAEGLKKEHLLDIGDPKKSTEHVEIRRIEE